MKEEIISFRHDSSIVTGHGGQIYVPHYNFPHVLRLVLDDATRKGLPEKVVIKKEAESKELFNNEYMVYQHLQDLQGKYIPNCYGVTYVGGSRSLILSDVGGVTMMDDRMPLMEDDELISKLRGPLERIQRAGILLDDVSPSNMLYCDGKFVAIDFQYARVEKNLQVAAEDVNEQVEALMERYTFRQEALQRIREERARWKAWSGSAGR